MNEGVNFTKHTSKETKVDIIQERKITSGIYGDIFESTVKVGNREKKFVIKKC